MRERPREHRVVVIDRERPCEWYAECCTKPLPRRDLIEEPEEQNAKDHLLDRLVALVGDVPYEILAHPVRSSIGVRESVGVQDRVIGPWRGFATNPLVEDSLSIRREAPVSVEHRGSTENLPSWQANVSAGLGLRSWSGREECAL